MDKNLLKSLLSRLSRHAFEKFIVELQKANKSSEAFTPLPEAGEGVYYQGLLDSYGGSLHTVFLLHYSPLELLNHFDSKSIGDPVIKQLLKNVRQLYKGQVGYWGMVDPFLKRANALQSVAFLTNLYNIDRATYEKDLIPQYSELVKKTGLKRLPVLVGSYDSFIELTPKETEQAFANFITQNDEGLCISISTQQASVERFSTERNLIGGVLQTTKYPYEPVYINQINQKETALDEFERLFRVT